MRPAILFLLGLALAAPAARAAVTPVEIPEELRRDFRVTLDPETGCVSSLQAFWGDPMGMGHPGCASYSIAHTTIPIRAYDFLMAHVDLFKLREGLDQLDLVGAFECLGSYYVSFPQRYRDVRVIGGMIQVRLDRRRRIEMVGANVLPGLDLDVSPSLTAEETRRIASEAIAGAIPSRTTVGEIEIDRPRRWPYPELPTAPRDDALVLVCRATVYSTQSRYPSLVRVDVHTGEVLSKQLMIPSDPR
jgi:hypothetical protein